MFQNTYDRDKAKIDFSLGQLSILFLCLFFMISAVSTSAVQPQEKTSQEQKKTAEVQEETTQTQEKTIKEEIPSFGYDIFIGPPEPIIEGPVDDSYLLSSGDEILITVWGELNLEYPIVVTEDGYITIPDEGGRIYTNGVTLKDLKRLATDRLSRIYSGYIDPQNPAASTAFVDVKVTKARKLLVYVLGEVENQGAYTIGSSVATVLNVLINAGGVKETGSLRQIDIRRSTGQTDTIDFYDFIFGRFEAQKSRLGYGDYVRIPLKQKAVIIQGEIRKPGKFELVRNEGIKELIQFAGGLKPNAYLGRCQIVRFEPNVGERFIDLDLTSIFEEIGKDFALQDGDRVTVFPNIVVRRRMVEIRGAGIKRPGIYQYSDGMTLKDLIAQAEGLKEDVYLDRTDLVRTAEDFSKKLTFFPLRDLYTEQSPGQYVFSGSEEKNFTLIEMDEITIYSSHEMSGEDKQVEIRGYVKEPGVYVLPENMTLYDLVFSRGGFQDEDFKRRVYLNLAHVFRKIQGEMEERVLTFNLGKLLEGDPQENFPLQDNDRIVIYSHETLETKPYVTIGGLVIRPGTYPMAENIMLEDLILLAGGLRPDAYRVEAAIGRIDPSGQEEESQSATLVFAIEKEFAALPSEEKTPLKAYDSVTIRNLPDWEPLPVVSIHGQIQYPGSYSLENREERISRFVTRTGGLRRTAFPEGAFLLRKKDIIDMSNNSQEERDRISINLKEALHEPGGSYDLVLRDGDQIFIPLNPGTVRVDGAVVNPLLLQYREGKNIDYYVGLCGGYHTDANKSDIIIHLPNNTSKKIRKGLFSQSMREILPGSTIEIPFKGDVGAVEVVEVRGGVKSPSAVKYRRGERLEYYITLCGGYLENADVGNIVITLSDGRVVTGEGAKSYNPLVLPGSAIHVPVK